MRALLGLLVLLLALPVAAGEVYRQTDEHGRVIFTDQPTPQAELVPLDPVNTTPAVTPVPRAKPEAARVEYQVRITSPEADAIIPNGLVAQAVVVQAEPAPRTSFRFRLLLDGEEVGVQADGRFTVPQLARGSHQFSAELLDADGRVLARGEPVDIFVYWPGGNR